YHCPYFCMLLLAGDSFWPTSAIALLSRACADELPPLDGSLPPERSHAALSSSTARASIAISPACGLPSGTRMLRSVLNVSLPSQPLIGSSKFCCRCTPATPVSITFGPLPSANALLYA